MKITAKLLAQLLSEELEEDNWDRGDIDPWVFKEIYDNSLEDHPSIDEDIKDMTEVLTRVAEKLNTYNNDYTMHELSQI